MIEVCHTQPAASNSATPHPPPLIRGVWQGFYLTCPTLPHLTFAGVAMPLTDVGRAAEEREAQRQLDAARRWRRRQGRQVVYDWPWQIPQRPAAPKPQPPPVDIVALAKAELAKDDEDATHE